jgi:hypothetical protein
MKYKPGDKVRIKSLDWYKSNECSGRVMCDGLGFIEMMTEYCGEELTIDFIFTDERGSGYVMKETKIQWRFTDGMIECLVDAEPQDKMVSLDKVCDILNDMLHNQWINDAEMVGTWAYYNMEEFMEDFCKKLEE